MKLESARKFGKDILKIGTVIFIFTIFCLIACYLSGEYQMIVLVGILLFPTSVFSIVKGYRIYKYPDKYPQYSIDSSPADIERDVEAEIIKYVQCDYELIDYNISVDHLMKLYKTELNKGKKLGYTPIIIVATEELLNSISVNFTDNGGVLSYRKKLLNSSLSNGKDLLNQRFKDYVHNYIAFNGSEDLIYGEFDTNVKPQQVFSVLTDSKRDVKILLLKVPTVNPYEAFAWIPFCGWNECPDTYSMMAICKYWYETYGAVPAVIKEDELEMYVENPIKEKEAAFTLAKEQYGFCNDIVEQGYNQIKILASHLINESVWSFWWD